MLIFVKKWRWFWWGWNYFVNEDGYDLCVFVKNRDYIFSVFMLLNYIVRGFIKYNCIL